MNRDGDPNRWRDFEDNEQEVDADRIQFREVWNLLSRKENYEHLKNKLDWNPALVTMKGDHGETLLMRAIRCDNYTAATMLVNHRTPINETNDAGHTALYIALEKGYHCCVNDLIKAGADINIWNSPNETPLSLAIIKGHKEVVDVLINRGLSLDVPENLQLTVLIKSIILGLENLTERLLNLPEFVKRINEKNESLKPPIIHACENNCSIRSIEMLIEKGASMNIRDNQGRDVLFVAVQLGKLELVKTLLKCGYTFENANLNTRYGTIYPNSIYAALKVKTINHEMVLTLINAAPKELLNEQDRSGNTIMHISAEMLSEYKRHTISLPFNPAEPTKISSWMTIRLFIHLLCKPTNLDIPNSSGQTAADIFLKRTNDENDRYIQETVKRIEADIRAKKAIEFSDACELIMSRKRIILMKKVLDLYPHFITEKDSKGETLLMKATQAGNYHGVFMLLLLGAPINERENTGFTVLYFAIVKREPDILNILLEYDADMNGWTTPDIIPLTVILRCGHRDLIDILVKSDANLEAPAGLRLIVLNRTIILGLDKLLIKLFQLEIYTKCINEKNKSGITPLVNAFSCRDRVTIVTMLLDKGASVYERDNNGRDALFSAAELGLHDIIELFLERGYKFDESATINEDKEGFPNALFAAIETMSEREETIISLVKIAPESLLNQVDQNGNTILHAAAKLKVKDLFYSLMFTRIDINVFNSLNKTPEDILLENTSNWDDEQRNYLAVEKINNRIRRGLPMHLWQIFDVIKFKIGNILPKVLNLYPWITALQDPLGETLLMKTIRFGDMRTITSLLKHGDHVNIRDNRRLTALYYAIEKGDLKIFNLLIEAKADINAWVTSNKTSLTLALERKHLSIINSLLTHRVNLEVSEKLQYRVLINAITLNCDHLIRKLLELDAYVSHINEKDELGKTPLIYACENNCSEFLIKMFVDKGALMDVKDNQGRDAAFIATEHGNDEIIDAFIKSGYKLDCTNLTEVYGMRYPHVIFTAIVHNSPSRKVIVNLIRVAPAQILNYLDANGNTALHLAAKFRLEAVYDALLDTAIDKNIINIFGRTGHDIRSEERFTRMNNRRITYGSDDMIMNYISKGNFKQINDKLRFELKVKDEYIFHSIDMIDTLSPERFGSYSSEVKIFDTLYDKWDGNRDEFSIRDIVNYAFALDKFKIIFVLLRNTFAKSIIMKMIEREMDQTVMSFKMIKTLEAGNYICSPARFVDRISYDIVSEMDHFYVKPFSEFLYMFTKGIVNNYQFKHFSRDFKLNNPTLEKAIHFRREDIAVVLLQRGCRPNLSSEYENLIDSRFSDNFKTLYKECKLGGLLTLERVARIEIRKDTTTFQDGWYDHMLRPILEFKTTSYNLLSRDRSDHTALDYAIMWSDYGTIRYLLNEMGITKAEFFTHIIPRHTYRVHKIIKNMETICDDFEFTNPLFSAISASNYREMQRLLSSSKVDINKLYGQLCNPLIYAVICGNLEVVKFLLKYGAQDASIVIGDATYGSREFAKICSYNSNIYEYLDKFYTE